MKINKDFIIRQIADETILVATGQASQNFNGMISLNEVASFILQEIEWCDDEYMLINRILDEFEADENTVREDVKEFLSQLLEVGIITKD